MGVDWCTSDICTATWVENQALYATWILERHLGIDFKITEARSFGRTWSLPQTWSSISQARRQWRECRQREKHVQGLGERTPRKGEGGRVQESEEVRLNKEVQEEGYVKSSPPLKSIKWGFMKVGFQEVPNGGSWMHNKVWPEWFSPQVPWWSDQRKLALSW